MRVSYPYVDSWAQAGTFWTGNNSNDPDANHLTGQDHHRNGHQDIYVLVLLLSALYLCVGSRQLLK